MDTPLITSFFHSAKMIEMPRSNRRKTECNVLLDWKRVNEVTPLGWVGTFKVVNIFDIGSKDSF